MGPNVSSNAKVQPGSGGNANKHRITRMTPEFIAYIVVQVSALSCHLVCPSRTPATKDRCTLL